MQRFVISVEVEDSLTADILSNFINAVPGVGYAKVVTVEPDDSTYGLHEDLSARRYLRKRAVAAAKDAQVFAEGKVCLASIHSSYSYRTHPCGKPAKSIVEVTSGDHVISPWVFGPNPAIPVCGIHARPGRYLSRYNAADV